MLQSDFTEKAWLYFAKMSDIMFKPEYVELICIQNNYQLLTKC